MKSVFLVIVQCLLLSVNISLCSNKNCEIENKPCALENGVDIGECKVVSKCESGLFVQNTTFYPERPETLVCCKIVRRTRWANWGSSAQKPASSYNYAYNQAQTHGYTYSHAFTNSQPFTHNQQYQRSQPFTQNQHYPQSQPNRHSQAYTYNQGYTYNQPYQHSQPFTHNQQSPHSQPHTQNQPSFTHNQQYSHSQPLTQNQPSFTHNQHHPHNQPYTQSQTYTHNQGYTYNKPYQHSQPFTHNQQSPQRQPFTQKQPFTDDQDYPDSDDDGPVDYEQYERDKKKFKEAVSNSFVVGGVVANKNEFPFMAAIGWPGASGGYNFRCGGFFITEKLVITAGHCAKSRGVEPVAVLPGGGPLDEDQNQIIPILIILKHPRYKSRETYDDIAIIKLNGNTIHTPANLWRSPTINFPTAIGIGYGHTEFSGRSSNELRKVTLSLFDNADCSRFYPPDVKFSRGLIDSQLCSGEINEPKDVCQGDSGGPLVVRDDSSGKTIQYVIGLTSFGTGCAFGVPSVFTRISSYIPWIESLI